MHLFFLTHGILRQEEEWKARLRAQMFPWKRTNLETGKEEIKMVQGALRPVQIWSYVFPEESLNDVLGGMHITGPIVRPELKGVTWLLRKMLKLEQIPETDLTKHPVSGFIPYPTMTMNGKPMPATAVYDMFVEGIACYPIGIKKDPKKEYDWTAVGQGKYFQEGL